MTATGKLSVILPVIESYQFEVMAKENGLYASSILEIRPRVNSEINRRLLTFSKNIVTTSVENIYIHEEGRNNYSKEYKAITKEFYLNF